MFSTRSFWFAVLTLPSMACTDSDTAGSAGLPGIAQISAALQRPASSAASPARVGVLFVSDPRGDADDRITAEVREISVSGAFPDAFTLELGASPPPSSVGGYARGSLVLLTSNAVAGRRIELGGDAAARVAGNVIARLTADLAGELGIASHVPLYVTHLSPQSAETVIDANFIASYDGVADESSPALAPGYHLGLFRGDILNADHLWHDCVAAQEESACGPRPVQHDDRSTWLPQILTESDTITFEVGGANDLMHTLMP